MLVKQWDGAWVPPEFLDRRHPQDFVRGVNERTRIRQGPPEQTDSFIENSQFIALEDGERLLGSEANAAMRTEARASSQVSAEDL